MTNQDLETYRNHIVSAHVDYTLSPDPVTYETLRLKVSDMYMAMTNEKAVHEVVADETAKGCISNCF